MSSNFSPMYFEQPIVIFDTTQSLNATTGAFVLYGGVSINADYQSVSTSSGAFVLSGGMAVQKDVSIGGIQHIYNDTESTGFNNGALIVDGGVGIAKNLHVGGDATIMGNLFVQGTYTYVNTETINVADNTLVINAGPGGSGDGGLLIHRAGSDVTISDSVTSGTLASVAQLTVTLPSGMDQTDNYYRGWWVKTSQGSAQITSYTSADRVAVLATSGNTLPATPSNTAFDLYNRSYLAQYYAETQDEVRFAYVADATDVNYQLENFDNYADVRLKSLFANTSVSTASIYTSGLSTIANLAVTNLLVASVTMDNAALKSATIGNLYVTGESVLHGAVTAGSLFVTAGSLFKGDVTVSGASVFNAGVTAGSLFVTGGSLLQGDVTVSGASVFNAGATAGSLFVTGGSLLQGDVTVSGASVFNAGATAGSLFVTGGSLFQGDVTVSGASVLNAGVTAGSLFVTGGSLFKGDVTVSGASVFNAGVTAGSLNITGASLFHLGLTGGSLNITGESWLQGAVTAGALNVTGNSILQGFVTAGSLNVTGDSILENNLTVTTGNVTISTNDYSPIIGATSASGGSIIFNTVDVSPSLGDISRERMYNTANAQTAASLITGFSFNNSIVRAFDAVVSVTVLTNNNTHKYSYYNLKGVQKSGNWVVNSSYVGDATGYTFSITNAGQIQYTSTSVGNYTNSYVSFRALTTSIQPALA